MRFTYGLLLLFLFLGRANASPPPDQTPSGEVAETTNITPSFKYHTECNVGGTRYIYFSDSASPNVILSISAIWGTWYPKDLADALVKSGFDIATLCTTNWGWAVVSKVSEAAVKRGGIRFKQREGFNATTYCLPTEETIAKIEDVLKNTYPKKEIGMEIFMLIGLAVFIVLQVSSIMDQRHRRVRKGGP